MTPVPVRPFPLTRIEKTAVQNAKPSFTLFSRLFWLQIETYFPSICNIYSSLVPSKTFSTVMSLIRRLVPSLRLLPHVVQRTPTGNVLPASSLQKRSISQSIPRFDNYEGDGRTTVTILDKELEKYLVVESCNEKGFFLSNESYVFGPIILFPNIILEVCILSASLFRLNGYLLLQWKVKTIHDITCESLTVFKVHEPKLDLVIVGIGDPRLWSASEMLNLKKEVKKSGLNVELLPTRHAVATYNFMVNDYRCVAGAFLPSIGHVQETLLKFKPVNQRAADPPSITNS